MVQSAVELLFFDMASVEEGLASRERVKSSARVHEGPCFRADLATLKIRSCVVPHEDGHLSSETLRECPQMRCPPTRCPPLDVLLLYRREWCVSGCARIVEGLSTMGVLLQCHGSSHLADSGGEGEGDPVYVMPRTHFGPRLPQRA